MAEAYLTPKQVELLEQQAEYLRDKLLVRILFRLACRISEALAITLSDIDWDQGTITIRHLKTKLKVSCPDCGAGLGKTHKFCPKCGIEVKQTVAEEREHQRMRTLPVDLETLTMLKEYVDRGGPRSGLLFGISRQRAQQIIKDLAERAGLPRIRNPETGKVHSVSPHRLRDAFAVHAVGLDDSGDGLRLLQEQLGHRDIKTTMKYRKVAGWELKRWHERLFQK